MTTSDFERRKQAALALLARTGVWRSNYEPPYIRHLWSLNVAIRPPHFLPFWQSAIISGAGFALIFAGFSLIMAAFGLQTSSELPEKLVSALIAGVMFGLVMGAYYAYGRRRYHLPTWNEL